MNVMTDTIIHYRPRIGYGLVYLLQCSNGDIMAYKIGVTKGDVYNRVKKLQTGNSEDIRILKVYETKYPYFIEKKMHSKYQMERLEGEWFMLSLEDVKRFSSDCSDIEKIVDSLKDNEIFMRKIK